MHFILKSLFALVGLLPCTLSGQGPVSGFFPEAGETIIALTLAGESFNRYNFGTESRPAAQTSRGASFFLEHGLKSHTSVILTAPYIHVDEDDRGFQDASVWIKYRNHYQEKGPEKWTTVTAIGLSFPISDYPVNTNNPIGSRATFFQGRLGVQYQTPFGVFFYLQSGIDFRVIPTVQNALPVLFRVGAGGRWLFAEAWVEYYNTFSNGIDSSLGAGEGSDWLRTGGTLYVPVSPAFGAYLNGAFVLDGENVGLSKRYGVGVVVRF